MQATGWEASAYQGSFRRHQVLALEAFERRREQGAGRAYVVMPPGAGKTVLGLEMVRRLARRTLVLTPNTAVQGQWLEQWHDFDGTSAGAGPHPQPAGVRTDLRAALTVLTYQSLSVWDRTSDDEEVSDDPAPGVAERRRTAVRDPSGKDLLSLLHVRGRELVERAGQLADSTPAAGQERDPWTLVLDECDHLLQTWGALVPALARALGPDTWVVGLSSTAAAELDPRQLELHDELFGDVDIAVPVPAAVKEGEVAPYQDLVLLTCPTPEEDTWILADRSRFAELQLELLTTRSGSLPFLDWLWRRLHERRAPGREHKLTWRELEEADPGLARAGLRLVVAGLLDLPPGARLGEQHRVPADANDWAELLGAYALEHLGPSHAPADARLLAAVHQVLPGLGFLLTGRGLRATTSRVDRVCALSQSKAVAAVQIMEAELAALGEDVRGLVLCDFEQRAGLEQGDADRRGGPDRPFHDEGHQAVATRGVTGSARQVFRTLASSGQADLLRPVLCTGRTVALRRQDLAGFRAMAPERLADRLLAEPLDGMRSLVRLEAGAAWTARVWMPLVTAWLQGGGARVVVGTRGLLGEGWDCPSLNVVVDLTSATGRSGAQLRGRSMRLDPERPDKVADNWTVACVADDHPRGDANYLRAVRKHATHLAPGRDGVIESGIGHCDDDLGPYAAPDPETRTAINGRALDRPAQRAAARQAWGIGQDYRGVELSTLSVRVAAPLGLPASAVPQSLLSATGTLGAPAPAPLPPDRPPTRRWPLPAAAGAGAAMAGTVLSGPVVGGGAGMGAGLLVGGGLVGQRYYGQLHALHAVPSPAAADAAVLRELAEVVADALHACGGADSGAAGVSVRRERGGWVAVELEAPLEQSRLFSTCLDELLAPLADPRWLVSRLVLTMPADTAAARRLARARSLGQPIDAQVTWHAVPSWLSRSRERVASLEQAWVRRLGAGRLMSTREPEGSSLLELLHGEDPFSVTTRLRSTWR